MAKQFVPNDFIVPIKIIKDTYVIKKLTVDDVEKDYKAVMSSKESLRKIFDENDDWPADKMTIEENYNDLKEHQEEFDNRIGFAYTVLNKDELECIGCIYIFPWYKEKYDSQIYFWVIDSVKEKGFENELYTFIRQWIKTEWPIFKPVFPGRDIAWSDWNNFKNKL